MSRITRYTNKMTFGKQCQIMKWPIMVEIALLIVLTLSISLNGISAETASPVNYGEKEAFIKNHPPPTSYHELSVDGSFETRTSKTSENTSKIFKNVEKNFTNHHNISHKTEIGKGGQQHGNDNNDGSKKLLSMTAAATTTEFNKIFRRLTRDAVVNKFSINRSTKLDFSFQNLSSLKLSEIKNVNVSEVEVLNLSHNVLHEMQHMKALESFINLQHMDLSENQINDVINFRLNRLKFLNVSCNDVTNFSGESFTELTSLDLSCNQIDDTSNLNLSALSKLEFIDVAYNQLTHINRTLLNNVKNLKLLNLAHNYLVKIPKDTFYNLENIETLLLSHNRIAEIENDTFSYLQNLQHLDLSHNQLHSSSIRALQGIPDLIGLSLANNPNLGNALQGFVASWSLKELDASATGLCQIPAALAQSVRTLKLADNFFQIIRCGDLDSYPLLLHLVLSSCNITEIEDDALGRLEILTALHLDNNNLAAVPTSLPSSLVHLYLQNNMIMELQPSNFIQLISLEVLDLSGNQITYLPSLPLPKLLTLNLISSELKGLSQLVVQTSPHLKDLRLDNNPVKCADLLGIAEWATPCRDEKTFEMVNDGVVNNYSTSFLQLRNYCRRHRSRRQDIDVTSSKSSKPFCTSEKLISTSHLTNDSRQQKSEGENENGYWQRELWDFKDDRNTLQSTRRLVNVNVSGGQSALQTKITNHKIKDRIDYDTERNGEMVSNSSAQGINKIGNVVQETSTSLPLLSVVDKNDIKRVIKSEMEAENRGMLGNDDKKMHRIDIQQENFKDIPKTIQNDRKTSDDDTVDDNDDDDIHPDAKQQISRNFEQTKLLSSRKSTDKMKTGMKKWENITKTSSKIVLPIGQKYTEQENEQQQIRNEEQNGRVKEKMPKITAASNLHKTFKQQDASKKSVKGKITQQRVSDKFDETIKQNNMSAIILFNEQGDEQMPSTSTNVSRIKLKKNKQKITKLIQPSNVRSIAVTTTKPTPLLRTTKTTIMPTGVVTSTINNSDTLRLKESMKMRKIHSLEKLKSDEKFNFENLKNFKQSSIVEEMEEEKTTIPIIEHKSEEKEEKENDKFADFVASLTQMMTKQKPEDKMENLTNIKYSAKENTSSITTSSSTAPLLMTALRKQQQQIPLPSEVTTHTPTKNNNNNSNSNKQLEWPRQHNKDEIINWNKSIAISRNNDNIRKTNIEQELGDDFEHLIVQNYSTTFDNNEKITQITAKEQTKEVIENVNNYQNKNLLKHEEIIQNVVPSFSLNYDNNNSSDNNNNNNNIDGNLLKQKYSSSVKTLATISAITKTANNKMENITMQLPEAIAAAAAAASKIEVGNALNLNKQQTVENYYNIGNSQKDTRSKTTATTTATGTPSTMTRFGVASVYKINSGSNDDERVHGHENDDEDDDDDKKEKLHDKQNLHNDDNNDDDNVKKDVVSTSGSENVLEMKKLENKIYVAENSLNIKIVSSEDNKLSRNEDEFNLGKFNNSTIENLTSDNIKQKLSNFIETKSYNPPIFKPYNANSDSNNNNIDKDDIDNSKDRDIAETQVKPYISQDDVLQNQNHLHSNLQQNHDQNLTSSTASGGTSRRGLPEQWNDVRSTSSHPGLFIVIGATIGMILSLGLVHLYRCRKPWRHHHHHHRHHHRHRQSSTLNNDIENFNHYTPVHHQPSDILPMEILNSTIHRTDCPIELW